MLLVSLDREHLEDTYDEWLAAMPSRMAEIEGAGLKPHRIDVAVDDLIAWCHSEGRVVDAAARAEYVAHKLRLLHVSGHLDDAGA